MTDVFVSYARQDRDRIAPLVRALEASAGAERGKLVPISIDPVAPRIGFRQFQTLEFVAWNQDPADPCVTLLVEALAAAGLRSRAAPATVKNPGAAPPVPPAPESPLFNLLGVPDEQKQLARFDGGHTPSDMNAVIRESLAWLDRWMGPVETQ